MKELKEHQETDILVSPLVVIVHSKANIVRNLNLYQVEGAKLEAINTRQKRHD